MEREDERVGESRGESWREYRGENRRELERVEERVRERRGESWRESR